MNNLFLHIGFLISDKDLENLNIENLSIQSVRTDISGKVLLDISCFIGNNLVKKEIASDAYIISKVEKDRQVGTPIENNL